LEDTQLSHSQQNLPPVGYRRLVLALRGLNIPEAKPIVLHSSLRAFGRVQGGADTVVAALKTVYESLLVPTFTYKTLVVPETGPEENAIQYGSRPDSNKTAEFFFPDMPADRLMGTIAETVRKQPDSRRSGHPVLSFAGWNARRFLNQQLLTEPLAPLASVYDVGGWVVLMGVDQTANTSIHLGERLAGRKMYTRWALMSDMVVTCSNFPYCSDGFNAIQPLIEPFTRKVQVGRALIQAIPMYELIQTTRQLIESNPTALLCTRGDCIACNTIRRDVIQQKHGLEPVDLPGVDDG
jgi:aminoglycoside 3-N-acetyltransferase